MAITDEIEQRSGAVRAGWGLARALLDKRRMQIQHEITNYPTPIPACDAHFNHLLEERGRITEELARLLAGMAQDDATRGLEAFLQSSRCLDPEARRQILEIVTHG